MAINVNIDNQLALKYSFKIGGKNRELTFDDDCALEMNRVEFKVQKIVDKIDNLSEKDIESKSVDEQVKLVSESYKEIREAIMTFFDKYFGNGAGQEIYEYANSSTRAMATIFGKVSSYLNKVEVSNKKVTNFRNKK